MEHNKDSFGRSRNMRVHPSFKTEPHHAKEMSGTDFYRVFDWLALEASVISLVEKAGAPSEHANICQLKLVKLSEAAPSL
ncbi:hypothetical protein ElyMa_003695500 [Elysia marginata]|uniref:Uncharacterized protein n=1 Tax=Elysia marginata TaxID=1093978 RepID=A0AAV4F1R8_9GAST|nr:hypothetical protein ElyMa_003695500 [Elysia marginata]